MKSAVLLSPTVPVRMAIFTRSPALMATLFDPELHEVAVDAVVHATAVVAPLTCRPTAWLKPNCVTRLPGVDALCIWYATDKPEAVHAPGNWTWKAEIPGVPS